MRKYSNIYEEAVSHIWLCNRSHLNFLIYEENLNFLFYQCGHPPVNPKTERTKDDLCVSLFISRWFNTRKWAYILSTPFSFLVCLFIYCSCCIHTKNMRSLILSKDRIQNEGDWSGVIVRHTSHPLEKVRLIVVFVLKSPDFFFQRVLNDLFRTAFSPSYDLAPRPPPHSRQ